MGCYISSHSIWLLNSKTNGVFSVSKTNGVFSVSKMFRPKLLQKDHWDLITKNKKLN